MCRNIKPLFNFKPSVSNDEVRVACVQFARKISASSQPSKVNEVAFQSAVDDISDTIQTLLDSLVTSAPPKDREAESVKTKNRAAYRFKQ